MKTGMARTGLSPWRRRDQHVCITYSTMYFIQRSLIMCRVYTCNSALLLPHRQLCGNSWKRTFRPHPLQAFVNPQSSGGANKIPSLCIFPHISAQHQHIQFLLGCPSGGFFPQSANPPGIFLHHRARRSLTFWAYGVNSDDGEGA